VHRRGASPAVVIRTETLMTRLILEHADKNRTGSKAEAGHDL
jgi:hypothetical protein